jgi:phage-related protein
MTKLFTLIGEFLLRGTDEAKQDINDVTKTAEQAESKMVTAFKKIGGVVAGAFAIDKIKDFGVAIVEASATVSAEMSAFEQIMGGYSDTAQSKLDEVAKTTGIVSTRLTPYMTSLTAKFKGLGNDIEESTDLATRGLTLASDASAFWDKSLDDSMSALNSFINGSYEGGEAIGLFANDTQLASYAVSKGIVDQTKDWANLDEATKQATRLEYAENMMALSGATGQASKESGSYANVQANLAEKWRQFKAEIGEPLLEKIVIPAMSKLSEVVDTLSVKWGELTTWVSENKAEIDRWVDILILAGTMVGAYVLTLGALSIIKTVTGWIKAMATGQALLNGVMAINPIALVVGALAGLAVIFVKAYNESETFRNIVNAVALAVKNAWLATVDWFKALPETFKNIWTSVKDWTVNTWNSIKTSASNIWNSIKTSVVNIVTSLVNGVKNTWSSFRTWITNTWNSIKTTSSNIWNSIKSIASNIWNSIKTTVVNIATSLVDGVKNGFTNLKKNIQNIWNSIKSGASSAWSSIKNVVTGLVTTFISGIKTKFTNFKSSVSNIWSSIKNGIVNAITSLPDKMKTIGRNIVEGLWNGINNAKDWVVGKVKGFGDSVLSGIKNFFGINSPSKVFAEIGKFLAEGLGIGIEDNADIGIKAIENTGVGILNGLDNSLQKVEDTLSKSAIGRRIGQAFGFEFVEAVEETVPEVENSVETIEEIVEESETEIKKKFSDSIREFASTANSYANTALSYITPMFDSFADLNDTELESEAKTIQEEIEALNRATDEKLTLAQKEHDTELELLKDKYEQGLISMAEYSAQKKALDKDLTSYKEAELKKEEEAEKKLAKEKNDILKKQFESKKKTDKANVLINLATAIMKAYAELGVIGGSIASVALGITSANQIKQIDAQKFTPAFAEGGIVEDATYGLVGEDGREAIVPLERNTEWVGGLARAISPAIVTSSQSNSREVATLREELRDIRIMLSEYLSQILNKNTDIVLNGESLAYALAPSIDTNLGDINRLRARGV